MSAMARMRERLRWRIISGEPMTVGDTTVTPQSQALVVRWAGGGLVWNRPVAVLVERGGKTQRLPIADVTRRAQWGLLGLTMSFALITKWGRQRRKQDA